VAQKPYAAAMRSRVCPAPNLVEKSTCKPAEEPETPLSPQMQQTGDAGDELPRLNRLGQVHLVASQE
jgi:hypothetical protein